MNKPPFKLPLRAVGYVIGSFEIDEESGKPVGITRDTVASVGHNPALTTEQIIAQRDYIIAACNEREMLITALRSMYNKFKPSSIDPDDEDRYPPDALRALEQARAVLQVVKEMEAK